MIPFLKKYKLSLILLIAILCFSVVRCQRQPTEPQGTSIRLSVMYSDSQSDNNVGAVQTAGHAAALMKAQAIDQARIMILDLTQWGNENDFWAAYDESDIELEWGYQQDSVSWDWQVNEYKTYQGDLYHFYGNWSLDIVDDHAVGTFWVNPGLNYLIIGFLDGDSLRYVGDTFVLANEGEENPAYVAMQQVTATGRPVVHITAPDNDATIQDRIITVTGTVSDTSVHVATLFVNDEPQTINVAAGAFANQVVLSRGENFIRVQATNRDGKSGSDMVRVLVDIPPVDIRVTLTWDTEGTDLDLHVIDPNQEEVYYYHSTSLIGGELDVDDTNGYGPENFTLEEGEAIDGEYTIRVKHFSGNLPSTATIIVTLYEDRPNEQTTTYGPFTFTTYGEWWDVVDIVWP